MIRVRNSQEGNRGGERRRSGLWPTAWLVALVAAALGLLIPSAASAEIRTAHAADPADAMPTISGVPNNPDIAAVVVSYDTAGSITITASFYNAFNTLDTSENFGFWGDFSITESGESYGGDTSYCFGTSTSGLYGQHHVYSNGSVTFNNEGSIGGYSGKLPFTRTEGADHKSVTISASSPALANHDWKCLNYSLHARTHASISNPYSEYGAGCDCWYVNRELDKLGNEAFQGIWFDGFQPPPPVHVITQKKSKAHGAVASPKCRTVRLKQWWITPEWADGGPQEFTGKMRANIDGKTKTFLAAGEGPLVWHIPRGYYTLRLKYLGDTYRTESNWASYPVSVRPCRHRHRHHRR